MKPLLETLISTIVTLMMLKVYVKELDVVVVKKNLESYY